MTEPAADHRAYRLSSIDMVRGLAIVVMALDHVRDFFLRGAALDPISHAGIDAGLFATRWITHFCAPVFVLLAGTSAGLMTARKSRTELARLLFTRGVWLIFIECSVVSTSFTFSPGGIAQIGGHVLIVMQVIWAIGVSMVVLSFAQLLGRRACLTLGIVIVAGHNLLDAVWPSGGLFEEQWPLWVALHSQMAYRAGPFLFIFVYPLLPWVGVIMLGFGVAGVFELPQDRRNTILLRTGIALTLGFLLLRAFDSYGDPYVWHRQRVATATVMDFLHTTKYPPSLAFLLMTLGPASVICAFADHMNGFFKETLVMYGRVPFAFYVPHFFLIHALSVALGMAQGFGAGQLMTMFFYYPKGYGVGLPGVYIVWMLVVVTLYPFCRWVAAVKARRRDWWLSYL